MGIMTDPTPLSDEAIRHICLDTAVQINLKYGDASNDGLNSTKPSIWTILDEADTYFRYIRNGAFEPPPEQ